MGAIIGDIVGSIYEWNNIKTKDFPLFQKGCSFTDDSVMTIAVAEGLLKGGSTDNFIDTMKKYGRLYPNSGYGSRFGHWLFSDSREAYNSWGNGSAMRVSPCGWSIPLHQFMRDGFAEVREISKKSAEVTHNHPEGIKGAQAIAMSIFYMRHGAYHNSIDSFKEFLKRDITAEFGYDLSQTLDEIRPGYQFSESCQETVPQAIIAFLESTDFEDAIRNAISLGGDSDTLAAITGSIAEAAYGIPDDIRDKALSLLDEEMRSVISNFTAKFHDEKATEPF
jgi:ADP-ribosylglycohydrolase